MKPLCSLFALLFALAPTAFAATDIETGTPIYFGNGCAKNSVSIAFAPDSLSFSVLYDEMVAGVSASDHRRSRHKTCEVFIPITLPKNTALSIENVDYRGFAALPTSGHASLKATYGFWPSVHGFRFDGNHFKRKFKAPYMDEYQISTDAFAKDHKPTSACGGKVYLYLGDRLNLHAKKGADAQITLDSVDGALGNHYSLALKRCKQSH